MRQKSAWNRRVWLEVGRTFTDKPSRYISIGFFRLHFFADRTRRLFYYSNKPLNGVHWQRT